MRTTLDLDDDLLRRAKEAAARTRRPLRAVVEDALRAWLSQTHDQVHVKPVELPVSTQPGGLCPGVDLDSAAALLDLMEGTNASG
jgi:hypothetical protein